MVLCKEAWPNLSPLLSVLSLLLRSTLAAHQTAPHALLRAPSRRLALIFPPR